MNPHELGLGKLLLRGFGVESRAAHPKQLCSKAPHCHRQHGPGHARLCVRLLLSTAPEF